MDLTRIFHEALLFSNYPNIPIRKSRDLLSLFLFTFSTEPGAYPDMENILSVYLRDTTLEDLPYIVGYGGEFCDGIFQQAGSRLVPDSSWSFLDMEHVRRRRRDALDRNAASYQADDAARQNAARRPSSAAYTRVRCSTSSNAIAGPSNQPGNGEIPGRGHGDSGESLISPNQVEIDLLIRLANGDGISHYDTLGFMEKCTGCGSYFLGSFFSSHVTSCT